MNVFNTSGDFASNNTPMSVPVRRYGSEPVNATLSTTCGPSSREISLRPRQSCF